ncbi:hypothetical protein [Methanoregula sp.]|uniref:hypothetical protein n=1 Tax=Methanoregula sp. TaxID=2052170 RepID=UPI003569E1AB
MSLIDITILIIWIVFLLLIFLAPLLGAAIATYLLYKKSQEQFSKHVLICIMAGLYLGICFSLIALLYAARNIYDKIIVTLPNLDLVLALLGISIAVFYAVDSIIDSRNSQKEILTELKKIKDSLKYNKSGSPEPEEPEIHDNNCVPEIEAFYQTNNDMIGNIRLSLQISYERSHQLINLNQQLIGIVAAIFIGALTFLGAVYFTSTNPESYLSLIITPTILIASLYIWRFYSHIIDRDIVNSYKKILHCEYRLNIPQEISLLSSLENGVSQKAGIRNIIKKQTPERKYLIFQKLIIKNRIGSRYHILWDFLVVDIFAATYCFQILFVINLHQVINPTILTIFLVMFPLFFAILSLFFAIDVRSQPIPFQRDPTCEDILECISEIESSSNFGAKY